METVGGRVAAAAQSAVVGREAERRRLSDVVDDPAGAAVVFVHGPGGIGKTSLVRAALGSPRTRWVEGRHVEPTPAGALAALAGAFAEPPSAALDVTSIASLAATHEVTALVLDDYERLGIIDGWLRNELIPALPATTTAVLVGRNGPNAAWRSSPGWRSLIAEVVVGPLSEPEARTLVARRSLDPERSARALRFGRGHPLALELAAEALDRHPDLEIGGGPPPEVVEDLVEVFFDDLEPGLRAMVEAACVLRRITLPLLAAVLDRSVTAVDPAWRALRELPFATVRSDGVELNPVVQSAAAAALELRDPGGTRQLRRRAARVALAEVARAPGWPATADLLHLVQNPVVRNAFLPPPGQQHPVEAARPDDLATIGAITERFAGPDEAGLIDRWWLRHPGAFSVARGAMGEVRAFSIVVEPGRLGAELIAADPVAAAVAEDLTRRPLRQPERSLFIRQCLTAELGPAPSPELALMIIDLKRTYLELRPALRRVHSIGDRANEVSAMMQALGFTTVSRPSIGEREWDLWCLELPPGSVDAWVAEHIELETAPPQPGGPHDRAADPLSSLTAREREVLTALADGLSNRELAERLFISERTANRHLSNIFTKLGVRNRTSAARMAIESGLAGTTTRID